MLLNPPAPATTMSQAQTQMSLPALPRDSVAKVRDFLQTRYAIKRPPHATAALLVLVYELWKAAQPWPIRREAAEHIGMSVYGLDGALSVATARGLITLSMETIEGSVARRDSVVKLRYYTPTPLLRLAIEG